MSARPSVPARLRVAMDARYLTSPILRGMDRYTVSLAAALARRGVDVTFLGRASQALHAAHLERAGARALLLPDPRVLWWEQVSVPRALYAHRFDLYHAPAERGIPRWAPCPTVLSWHSATEWSYADMVRRRALPGDIEEYLGYDPLVSGARLHRWYYHRQPFWADRVLTVSAFARREILELAGISADRVRVTPLAVDDSFTGSRGRSVAEHETVLARLGVRRPFLLYVGGYERHKNVAGLLRCFAACRAAHPRLQLVAVGTNGVPQDVKGQARDLGIAAEVVFLADLSDELVALYDSAEAFISLSWREGFGLPALEALSRGLAVVVSRLGASPEVVGPAAILVDPCEPEAAARQTLAMLARPRRAEDIAARVARARQFSWERCAELTIAAYEDLLRYRRRDTTWRRGAP